jgi:hypothetical protein
MADAELYGVSEYPMMGRGYKWTMTYRTRRVVSQRTIPERITSCFTLNNATEFNPYGTWTTPAGRWPDHHSIRSWPAQYAGAGCRYFMKIPIKHKPSESFTVPIKLHARRPRGGAYLVRTGPYFQGTYPGQGVLLYRLKSVERRAQ